MTIKPIGNRVLTQKLTHTNDTINGIYIPDIAKELPQEYKIIALGTGGFYDNKKPIPFQVKVGDLILADNDSGVDVKFEGHNYKIFLQEEILATVTK